MTQYETKILKPIEQVVKEFNMRPDYGTKYSYWGKELHINNSMYKFFGQPIKVARIFGHSKYQYKDMSGWHYVEGWFEKEDHLENELFEI